jgi:hypothetical protein
MCGRKTARSARCAAAATSEQSAPAGCLSGSQATGASDRWIAALPDMSHFAAEFLQKLRRPGLRGSHVR